MRLLVTRHVDDVNYCSYGVHGDSQKILLDIFRLLFIYFHIHLFSQFITHSFIHLLISLFSYLLIYLFAHLFIFTYSFI